MIQNIQNNYETYSKINSITTNNTIQKTTINEETVDTQVSTQIKMDTVEISVEGKLASESQVQSDSLDTESLLTESKSIISNATNEECKSVSSGSVPIQSSTESTEETETTTVLTNLTEEELEDLVEEGTITQSEMNAELARRETLETAEKNELSEEKDEIESSDDIKVKSNINLIDEK